ncbi:hypothetical protein [Halobaculum sp. D14]|uniref:hypothetical protein n=1 Tax=unclassified Halobaculum TaxID=2640896 RepID=UPI003EBC7D9C
MDLTTVPPGSLGAAPIGDADLHVRSEYHDDPAESASRLFARLHTSARRAERQTGTTAA